MGTLVARKAAVSAVLPFAIKPEEKVYAPRLVMPGFQVMAYTIVFAPIAIGTALVVRSFRRHKLNVESCRSPDLQGELGDGTSSPPLAASTPPTSKVDRRFDAREEWNGGRRGDHAAAV